MLMVSSKYSLSFTTGALFFQESIKLAALYASMKKWDEVRNVVVAENSIQARTTNSLKRVTNEIISRLKTLSDSEIHFLAEAAYYEQGYILWIAVCRRYEFIADFAIDVLHDSFVSLKKSISYDEYNIFFNKKAEWHNEMDEIASSTKRKLRQTLFQMMQEANILEKNGNIIPVLPSAALQNILAETKGREVMFFPMSDLRRGTR
jgi:hypothetical protein